MRHSQSHLISLAVLLQSAEARHSATPPPMLVQEEGSGLIDILAMQKRAKEERANAEADAAATRTPVPTVSTVRTAETDPDLVAALAGAERRKKRMIVGGIAGVLVLVATAVGFQSSRGTAAAAQTAQTAIVQAPVPVVPVVAPPPPAPVVVAGPAPAVPAVTAPVVANDPPVTTPKSKKKSRKASHAKSKGPKLMKVTSSGVAP